MKLNLLEHDDLVWTHYREEDDYPYPVSYWGTIIDIDDSGHLSLLYRWDPHKYCHFHRHLCAVSSVILAGELHVSTFEGGEATHSTVRSVGHYSKMPPGDVHMEQGGADGALVLFELYAPDGLLTDQLNSDGAVKRTVTTDDLRKMWARQHHATAA